MTRVAPIFARRALLLLLGTSPLLACASVTTVAPEAPILIEARPPAPPLPDLPAVAQPPLPPPRVIVDGDVLGLDEVLSFDEAGLLSAGHEDILAEVGSWLAAHAEVAVLRVEAQSVGKGSKRTHDKRSKALAQQVVDALVAQGVAADRLQAVGLGQSPDDQRHVILRVGERGEN